MKLWPTRQNAESELVADLDMIISRSVSFKLHGKIHVIEPFTTEQFLIFASKLAALQSLQTKKKVTVEELQDSYFEVAKIATPTITKEDINQMKQTQLIGLFDLMLKLVTGKPNLDYEEDSEKKKT